jgi:putative ABC transport system permease protein
MRILYTLRALARAVLRSRVVDDDLNEEVHFHIERQTEANIARGMTPDAARRAARLQFGSVDDALETARDDRPGSGLRQIGRDLSFGLRLLTKAPAFGVAGITIVALGIGAVTAIFSVVYGVMLRPLPFREPDRLINLWSTMPGPLPRLYPNAADVTEWRRANRSFEDIAMVRLTANLNLVGDGEPERLQGGRFSPNLLPLLGVKPAIGRNFASDENLPGKDQVVLLSDGIWRRRFAGDPSVVGRTIQLNGLPHTVIGVMPPEFRYPTRDYQAWLPIVVDPRELTRQETQNYVVIGRLRPGVTVDQAHADMEAISQRIETQSPFSNHNRRVLLQPMLDSVVRDIRSPLVVLLTAASGLLLIACLNLSNLLSARAAARSAEYSVRLALGASRGRLAMQAIAEVVPMLGLGGALGIATAVVGVRAFVATAPAGVPRIESVAVSAPVFFVSLAVLVISGLIASIAPAVQAWRSDFTAMTKDGGRGATSGRRRARGRRIGVAAQIAVALPLLVGAGLLIRSAMALGEVDLGFRPDGVAAMHIAVSRTKHPTDVQVATYYDQLLENVRAVPGVQSAGMVNRLPLFAGQTASIDVESASGKIVDVSAIDSRLVTPDYFATLGIALREGRAFGAVDDVNAPLSVIVDDRLASTMWPGTSALGKRLRRTGEPWGTVIGVVAHIRAVGVDEDLRSQVYWSHRQLTQDRVALVVRGTGDPAALVKPVIDAIHAVDRDQPVYDVRTMDAVVARSLARRNLTTMLITTFGGIALVLAAVGIYGVVAYGVTQRLREFGIRIALGATSAEVSRLVLREGTSMALAGAGVGIVAALVLSGVMSNLVFGVAPRDAISLGAATVTLIGVAVIASYIPARRASAVDPAVTLRSE